MKFIRTLVVGLLCGFTFLPAFAGGALSFLTTPTTVNSGDAVSWMNGFADWDQISALDGSGYVIPNLFGAVSVTTSRTATDLILKFDIPDSTHKKPDGTPLTVGDQVIVEIDTNATRGATLTAATAVNPAKDFRYQIVIGTPAVGGVGGLNAITSASVSTPIAGNNWGSRTAIAFPGTGQACPASYPNGCATLSLNGSDYVVTLNIPLASIGSPANDIGLAILVSNDLGNTHTVGGSTVSDQTAVSFSFADMPAGTDPFDDPGLVTPATNGTTNVWNMPNHWGAGVFNAPSEGPGALSFSHTPQPYFSTSIKISACNIGRWEDIQAADASGNQTALVGWYKYERDAPCKMGIWVDATNSSPSASATARLLVLWADAGLSANTWRVVELTGPISFGPGQSISHVVWDKVPSKGSVPGGTSHPCLRIYLLPTTDATDPNTSVVQTAAVINAIHDAATVAAMERAYGFHGDLSDAATAQMNFTNLANGSCSNAACTQPVIGRNIDLRERLLSLVGLEKAVAQPTVAGVERAVPLDPNYKSTLPKVNDPWFGVSVQGFAVPVNPPALPYVFLQSVGGVAWGVPYTMVAANSLGLGFKITNPPILYRDLLTSPMQEIAAPKRLILLSTAVHAPTGMPTPVVTISGAPTGGLDPGNTVPGAITVPPTPISTLPGWIRCLLAGNIWCWLILLLIIAILVLLFRRKWAH